MSPSPRRSIGIRKKQTAQVLSPANTQMSPVQMVLSQKQSLVSLVGEGKIENNVTSSNDGTNKYENISDNGSEISDEGYRSLGVISSNAKRIFLYNQMPREDADTNGNFQ